MKKLKKIWLISLFIITLIIEVILFSLIGKELSEEQIIIYAILLINTSIISCLGMSISERLGYK